jgi:palmitoyltransferase
MEQPLRCKHCKECNKCVSLHDHHCPWLGNCIGARNRVAFYWYLVAQSGELWMALLCIGLSLQGASSIGEWFICNLVRLAVSGVVVFFTGMVTSLLVFHTYLAVCNLTTCEG